MKDHAIPKRMLGTVMALGILGLLASASLVSGGQSGALNNTVWALVPSLVAICLALMTKEVYSSLFCGVLVGGLFSSGFQLEGTITQVLEHSVIRVLSDEYNIGILIFLVLLGAIVVMMNKSGGSAAFGRWASHKIKTAKGAQLATIGLGVLIFVDDYFNCLTVGSVMRPVADKHGISRAKLAYLIDATAAPVCIIAPISSWAAAVAGFVEGEDGFSLFLRAIPYNYYALLMIVMMVGMVLLDVEFGPMVVHQKNASNVDLVGSEKRKDDLAVMQTNRKGTMLDLILPVAGLISFCSVGMLYSGGFFGGTDFVTAFSNCNASVGLVLGSFFAMVFTIVWYLARKIMTFGELMECIPEGLKAMSSAMLILTLAWALKSTTESLGAAAYVEMLVKSGAQYVLNFLPAIVFLVGGLLAFASGTSWGTFGILIPIVVDVFSNNSELMIMAISACMAGAVCGDHCSPISDTTIMASTGAQCDHVNHVTTQLPYVVTCAIVSFCAYLIAGFVRNVYISLLLAMVLMGVVLFIMKMMQHRYESNKQ